MKAVWLCVFVVVTACNPATSPTASVTSTSTSAASSIPTPSESPERLSSSYGLIVGGGSLYIIDSHGLVANSAALKPSSIGPCPNGMAVAVQPPVSATMTNVFFRDGDTEIRELNLRQGDLPTVATVPGGPNTVSFFSVSPDDRRIAVEVVTLSGPAFSERLYVEDFGYGTHHVDLYSTTSATTTLWPMGWDRGNLLLALMPACAADVSRLTPLEWHVSSASTGNRIATINVTCVPEGHSGSLSRWPSPHGVMCAGALSTPTIFNWDGSKTAVFTAFTAGRDGFTHADLSPSGHQVFLAYTAPSQGWEMLVLPYSSPSVWIEGHEPCLWMDEDHLLASDAVVGVATPHQPFYGPPPPDVPGTISPIAVPGVCAGVYPNPL